ncbi:MAG: oligosaccharide flippase family protein, partial [Actinomycetota bacterium]|nr:oligosaccharide flippase family protein [Actinomycetota bacterium]
GMFTGAVAQVFFPYFAANEPRKILEGIQRYSSLILKIGLPLLIFYGLALQILVPIVFGDKWNAALPMIFFLILFYGSSLLHHPVSGIPFICRKPHWELNWNIFTLILRLGLLYVGLLHSFNMAILLFCIGSGLMNLLFYFLSIYLLKGSVVEHGARVGRGLIPAIVLGSLAWMANEYNMVIPGFMVLGSVYTVYLYLTDREVFSTLGALLSRSAAK